MKIKFRSLTTLAALLVLLFAISVYMLHLSIGQKRLSPRFLTGKNGLKVVSDVTDSNSLRSNKNSTRRNRTKMMPDFSELDDQKLTIVTAYFDIGSFHKGAGGPEWDSVVYRKWMKIFARINNPLVAYFDSADNAALMKVLRENHPQTRIILIERSETWAFAELQPDISRIFSQKGYPNNPPNTVVPAYSAAMHAKYDLMQRTISENPFGTAYICWLDVGLFREMVDNSNTFRLNRSQPFQLWLPAGFDKNKVAYSEISRDMDNTFTSLSAEMVVKTDAVWVCGCFFIGRVDTMWYWTFDYMEGVEQMITTGWISTDQQVIYWLFLGEGKKILNVKTSLQTFKSNGRYNAWFYLGFLAKEAGELRNNKIIE